MIPAPKSPPIAELLRQRILVKDGAMGTMIQREGLVEEDFRGARFAGHDRELQGNNDLLVLTQPDLIVSIHERFLEAGADILGTTTFNSTSVSQADYGTEALVSELNREAAQLARLAASCEVAHCAHVFVEAEQENLARPQQSLAWHEPIHSPNIPPLRGPNF